MEMQAGASRTSQSLCSITFAWFFIGVFYVFKCFSSIFLTFRCLFCLFVLRFGIGSWGQEPALDQKWILLVPVAHLDEGALALQQAAQTALFWRAIQAVPSHP